MSSLRSSGRVRPGSSFAFLCAAAALLAAGFSIVHSSGYVGATRKNGFGCLCHAPSASSGVQLRIVGPRSVMAGSDAIFTLEMTGGPATAGGFDVAAYWGALAPGDSTSYLDAGELTHAAPKAFTNDTVRWPFVYHAPSNRVSDTLYAAGNSVNGDRSPNGDAWNFSADLAVEITPGAGVGEGVALPSGFSLEVYPNPFNPAATFECTFRSGGHGSLVVYDAGGRSVATIFAGPIVPGVRRYRWNAAGIAGGIYIALLRAGDAATARKVLLLK